MKKGIIISTMVISTLGLTAIGIVERKDNAEPLVVAEEVTGDVRLPMQKNVRVIPVDEFALDVGPRFLATVSRNDLSKATSINEIIPADAGWEKHFFSSTHVRIVNSNIDIVAEETGYNLNLTEAQLALLKTAKYSDDLQFGTLNGLNYMVTVVPEKQAVYKEGTYELISHLRNEAYNLISLQPRKQWGAGKIKFTVDASGAISKAILISSSGSETIDQHMIQSISELPSGWIPAENDKGEKVAQVLTLSFGSMGC